MDTKIKLLIFLLFTCLSVFGQEPPLNLAVRLQITSAVGSDPYTVTGIVSDDLSRFIADDIQVGDSLYVLDGSFVYVLGITSITSVVGPTIVFVANDPNDAGISLPTGQAAIIRPTLNYKLPTYISGLRDDLRSAIMNRQAQLIDNISGGGVASITDFISAGAGVPPSASAAANGGETWRNMTTGELWGSNGSNWYPYTRGPKECQDTVLVSAITIQSGGSLTTGSPLVRNASGVWEHMYNHPSGTNLIPDGVVTDIITGPKAIIQYCGVRKGSGATPNTSYYVDQTQSTGFTTTKPTTNIRPLGKVASNGDFIINAGLLFSKDNYPNLITSVELSGTGQGSDSLQLAQQNARIGDALLWDGTSQWKPFHLSATVKEFAARNKLSNELAFSGLLSYYSSRGGKVILDTFVNITTNTTVASNISIEVVSGGRFNISNSVTLTINGYLDAPHAQQIFNTNSSGNVGFSQTSVKEIFPYWFGAKNDGVTDCQPALQKAINTAISSKIKVVRLLDGAHLLNKGVVIKDLSTFVTLEIKGNKAYDGIKGTSIKAGFNNGFAIGIQGARAVKISGIYFQGFGNSYNPSMNQLITNSDSDFSTNWGRNSRYSPNSAIVVDPFCNSVPPDGGYPGFTSEYSNNALSSNILIEDVLIRYWLVGIALSPSTQTGNGSEIIIRESVIDRCQYGIVTCQTQARSIDVVNTNIASVQTCLDGLTFGNREGPMPNSTNVQFGACKDILRFSNGGGDGKIVNMYGESIYRIGLWSGNFGTLTLIGCEINFTTEPETGVADAASILDSGSKITFLGGFLGYSTYRPVVTNCKTVELIGTSLRRLLINNPNGGTISNQVSYTNCRVDGYLGTDQQDLFTSKLHFPNVTAINGQFALPGFEATYLESGTNSNQVILEEVSRSQDFVELIDAATVTVNNTTHSASWTTSYPGKYKLGDILTAYNNTSSATPSGNPVSTTFGIVTNISGNTITTSYASAGIVSGSYPIYLFEAKRIIPAHKANITAGSNKVVITSKSTHATLSSLFPIGTRVYYDEINGSYTYGLLPGLYVTSIVADTLFLSGNVATTLNNIELFGASVKTTYLSQDNTYQTGASTYRNVGYRSGDIIKFKSHSYRESAIVTSGGFTPTVKFNFKSISGSTGSRPTPESVDVGLQYYNTTTNTTQWWDGTTWREAGSGVSSVNTASPVSGDGSVGTPITIASGAITNTYLATNSVDSTKVLNGNITSSKIQDGSIVAADLAPTGVTAGTFNNVTVNNKGQVTNGSNVSYLTGNQTITLSGDVSGSGTTSISNAINTGAVNSAKILDGSVSLVDLASNSVDSTKIVGSSVTSSKILDGTIVSADLAATGVGAGTYNNVTVNTKGQVTSGSNASYVTGSGTANRLAIWDASSNISSSANLTFASNILNITGRQFLNNTSSSASTPDLVFGNNAGIDPFIYHPNAWTLRIGRTGVDWLDIDMNDGYIKPKEGMYLKTKATAGTSTYVWAGEDGFGGVNSASIQYQLPATGNYNGYLKFASGRSGGGTNSNLYGLVINSQIDDGGIGEGTQSYPSRINGMMVNVTTSNITSKANLAALYVGLGDNSANTNRSIYTENGAAFAVNRGNVSIGMTGSSARLHLPAGTASANSAPLKFTAGTNLTSPESGAVEWDGTKLYITQAGGNTRKTIAYTTDFTSESTTIGAFQSSGNSNGLTLSGTDIRLHAATISTPGGVSIGQQTFTSGGGTKIFNGSSSGQVVMDGNTDNTPTGINFTQQGTDLLGIFHINSSDADNASLRFALEQDGGLADQINVGTLNDTKGIYTRNGLYEDVTAVTTSPYTVQYGDRNIYLDGTSITVNLQAIGTLAGETKVGRVLYFFNDNATSVTIVPNGAELINDGTSLTLPANTGVTLLSVTDSKWITRD